MHSIFAFLAITTMTSFAPVELPTKAIVERSAINVATPTDAVRSSDVIYFDAPIRESATYLR